MARKRYTKSKRILECPECGKQLGSPAALRSHQKSVHRVPNPVAPARGDELNFNLSMPMRPAGLHEINCPLCATPTILTVNENGEAHVGKPSSKRPSSSGATKHIYPHYVREHPIVIRERIKQRKGKKTLVMMGTHGRSGPLAPWSEIGIDEWWGLNDSATIFEDKMSRFDRWFQLHHRWRFTRRVTRHAQDHWKWLQEATVPKIYMQRHFADVPNSVKYPLREVCDLLIKDKLPRGAGYVQQYFASTFSYMLALVIYEKLLGINDWERIEIYGCELEQVETEYFQQRPGMEWWLGQCAAHGIEVYFPQGTFIAFAQNVLPGRIENYPGYMTYGYDSPNKAEALSRGEPLGEDPIEENLVGTWEDLPYKNFVTMANRALVDFQIRTNWTEDFEETTPLLNELLERTNGKYDK
jgi:hypothetical protein